MNRAFPALLFPNLLLSALALASATTAQTWVQSIDPEPLTPAKPLRVFVFAGQSNMVGSDSHVEDVQFFPPFRGLEEPQPKARFLYCIGREDKRQSEGFVPLQPVNGVIGPELSFAREVMATLDEPIAIVKIAAGGTTIGRDWNPEDPGGFELYPLALETVRDALATLKQQRVPYRLEAFFWHQGENDMFDDGFRDAYGQNLANFLASWRRDLEAPELPFFIGELCTKTIWGMDNRMRMYGIREGQIEVTEQDERATYVPTSHVGVEISRNTGLHYHYGTLGQLEHGVEYARAYLRSIDALETEVRSLRRWPYDDGEAIDLYVLAGHRNMEGERAFVDEVRATRGGRKLARDDPKIAFRYALGGGARVSTGFEPLGPTGAFGTFGPELSFARTLWDDGERNFAIAKFTHSGSQAIDWTPEGSEAVDRNLHGEFLTFVRESVEELESRGHAVRLARVIYHIGENDTAYGPYRRRIGERLDALVAGLRTGLERPDLTVLVSHGPAAEFPGVVDFDVATELRKIAADDRHLDYLPFVEFPEQRRALVLDTHAIVLLGQQFARAVKNDR
ncbi:MAG: sialate O-acetylesterase [Planctomycetota bacterium]